MFEVVNANAKVKGDIDKVIQSRVGNRGRASHTAPESRDVEY
jgi:hypothetical protein